MVYLLFVATTLSAVCSFLVAHAQSAVALGRREGNLDSSFAVSDPSSIWRAFACMDPFTAADGTPLLILYGGTNNTDASDPLQFAGNGDSRLHVFGVNSNRWYAPSTNNAPSNGPVLPGCGTGQGNIWVYDPHYGTTSLQSSPISLLDSVHWSWSLPTEDGQLPVTRFGAAFAYVSTNENFYMHGGIPLSSDTNKADNPPGIANNLDILSPSSLSWTYASNGPARKYHSLCYISSIDSLILFGGSDQNIASYNDVKTFSIKSSAWQYSLNITGDAPSERVLHSAVCTDDSMIVFGGTHQVGDTPSDSNVWVLTASDETTFAWSKAPISSSSLAKGPSARAGHAAVLYSQTMYIYGGIGPSNGDDTMYTLDVSKWAWSQISAADMGSKNNGGGSGGVNTRVLIAAIVSSVLGVICVGIAAFVFYRWNRRRGVAQYKQEQEQEQEQEQTHNNDDNDNDNGDNEFGKAEAGKNNINLYLDDDKQDGGNNAIVATSALVGSLDLYTRAVQRDSYVKQYEDPNYLLMLGSSGSTTVHGRQTSSDIVANDYLPPPHTNPSVGSSSVGSFSLPMTTEGMPAGAATNGIVSHPSSEVTDKARSVQNTSDSNTADLQESPSHRLSSAYAPTADVINGILLSGQPIPAWLREAANQSADQKDSDIVGERTLEIRNKHKQANEDSNSGNGHEFANSTNTNSNPSPRHIQTEQGNNSTDNLGLPPSIGKIAEGSSIYSSNTNDTQSALVYEPIQYVNVSRTPTGVASTAQTSARQEAHQSNVFGIGGSSMPKTRRRASDLSDIDFNWAALQNSGIAISNNMTDLTSIAQPMAPPVPLRMNSLYGELESRGILVGEASIPQASVATTSCISVEDSRASTEAVAAPQYRRNGFANTEYMMTSSASDDDNEILSPLGRLARYHNIDSWMASETGTDRAGSPSQWSNSNETDDTSNIYAARPVRQSSDGF
ncbi:hypothetical protein GGI25_001531 [Coemansia spiralis]|uniref:Galactose oxidase n=2 Tax=Coemansia TaxID=4863 RepID=A0A9W8GA72_9FUNG|nr:hypothetical protein EDC05_002034 [Coemansia umbellata]KAJ2679396.1 hypothetical protein GGI25_001531 [Coemansia spiralis]